MSKRTSKKKTKKKAKKKTDISISLAKKKRLEREERIRKSRKILEKGLFGSYMRAGKVVQDRLGLGNPPAGSPEMKKRTRNTAIRRKQQKELKKRRTRRGKSSMGGRGGPRPRAGG